MPAVDVQFQTLHATLGPFGLDRVCVALVHWDGADLRFVLRAKVAGLPEAARTPMVDALKSLRRTLNGLRKQLSGQVNVARDLNVHLPVIAGEATGLVWSELGRGVTHDPQAHFEALSFGFGLAAQHQRVLTRQQMRSELTELGRDLLAGPDLIGRVETEKRVEVWASYESPLSWRNGIWRHAIPLSLIDATSRSAIESAVREQAGRLQMAFPPKDKAVLVVAPPADRALREMFDEGVLMLAERVERLDVAADATDNRYAALREKVRSDVLTR